MFKSDVLESFVRVEEYRPARNISPKSGPEAFIESQNPLLLMELSQILSVFNLALFPNLDVALDNLYGYIDYEPRPSCVIL